MVRRGWTRRPDDRGASLKPNQAKRLLSRCHGVLIRVGFLEKVLASMVHEVSW